MRVLLFTGKGGVGKTTFAAATGAMLASQGQKTLVISTDPAHSLGDAFGYPLTGDPSEVDECLYAMQIQVRDLADRAWPELRVELRTLLTDAGIVELDAAELTVLPGVDDLLTLFEVRRLVETGRWTHLIVDCGPTAETLRLLSLPEAISRYLTKIPRWQTKAGMLGGLAKTRTPLRGFTAQVEALRDLLSDTATTTVRLVFTPERMVAAETRRTLSLLALRGIRVDGLIANRLVPAPGIWRGAAAAWMRTRRGFQEAVLTEFATAGLASAIVRIEHRAVEPVGLPDLQAIAAELYPDGNPVGDQTRLVAPLLDVRATAGGYQLRVNLPLTPDATVELARIDNDLAITVAGFRRLITLPELLHPCRVTGAETDDRGVLVSLTMNRS